MKYGKFMLAGLAIGLPVKKAYNYIYGGEDLIYKNYGNGCYAMVIGANDSIGEGFCKALAEKGINIVLVGKSQNNLARIADEISEKYGVKTITWFFDLSKATDTDFKALKNKTDEVEVSMLINATRLGVLKPTHKLSHEEIEGMINTTTKSLMHLLRLYLPELDKRQGRSAVIHLSSLLSIAPVPILSLYGATQAFVRYITMGLSEEYSSSIDFLSYEPGSLIPENAPPELSSWKTAPLEASIAHALKDLGHKRTSYGHFKHELLASFLHIAPTQVSLRFFYYLLNQQAEQLKQARQAKQSKSA
jgi:short-subunit dehydrogenase